MKKSFFALPLIIASLAFTGARAQNEIMNTEQRTAKVGTTQETKEQMTSKKKILVAYFSHSGNTREIANRIHEIVGGDIFEIQTVQTYPRDYDAVVKQAQEEQQSGYKPKLKSKMKDIGTYDVIFIGYPNWWGTIPMPIVTFFSEYNFPGKTVIPFCTHEGSRLGRSVSDIKKLCPRAKVLDGLAVRGSDARNARNEVYEWLHAIGMTR